MLSNLRSRLVAQLGIEPPILYSCSAQVVMDYITGEEPVPPDLLVWKERFKQLENLIINRLCQERLLTISENVLRLLTRLFEQLKGHLNSQWENYQRYQKAIEQEVLPDLTLFTTEQDLFCQQILSEVISKMLVNINHCVEEHREQSISKIYNAIFNAEDFSALENVIKNEVQSILNIAQHDLKTILQNKIHNISQAAILASHNFDSKFTEVYRRLQTLEGWLKIENTVNDDMQINTLSVFTSVQCFQEEMDTKDGFIAFGGIATGLAIGTAILPIVGTAIGGLVGLILSGGIIGASLDKRKQQFWEKLHPALNSYFDSLKGKAQNEIQTYSHRVSIALKQRIDNYMAHYKAVVDNISLEQKTELQRLTNLQTTMEISFQEIERRQKFLYAQQQRLATIKGK